MRTRFIIIILLILLAAPTTDGFIPLTLGAAPGSTAGLQNAEQAASLAARLSTALGAEVQVRLFTEQAELGQWLQQSTVPALAVVDDEYLRMHPHEVELLGPAEPGGKLLVVASQSLEDELRERVATSLKGNLPPLEEPLPVAQSSGLPAAGENAAPPLVAAATAPLAGATPASPVAAAPPVAVTVEPAAEAVIAVLPPAAPPVVATLPVVEERAEDSPVAIVSEQAPEPAPAAPPMVAPEAEAPGSTAVEPPAAQVAAEASSEPAASPVDRPAGEMASAVAAPSENVSAAAPDAPVTLPPAEPAPVTDLPLPPKAGATSAAATPEPVPPAESSATEPAPDLAPVPIEIVEPLQPVAVGPGTDPAETTPVPMLPGEAMPPVEAAPPATAVSEAVVPSSPAEEATSADLTLPSAVPEVIAQPDLPFELRPLGVPLPRPTAPAVVPAPVEEPALLGKFQTLLSKTPAPEPLIPPPDPEPGVVYVVPFITLMVPQEVAERVFDQFVDILNQRGESQRLKFVILKQGLDNIERNWLGARKHVMGEIFGYVEDSGCCSTTLRAHARLTYFRAHQAEPALKYDYPVQTFFDHDRSNLTVEREKLADQIVSALVGELFKSLQP